jgi:hypothetical protein
VRAVSEHRYKMTYEVHRKPEGFTKAELNKMSEANEDLAAADAVLIASILYPEDGSLSVLFIGYDGRTDETLSDLEWFKVWVMLTSRLSKSKTLHEGKRELCGLVFETIAAAMRG